MFFFFSFNALFFYFLSFFLKSNLGGDANWFFLFLYFISMQIFTRSPVDRSGDPVETLGFVNILVASNLILQFALEINTCTIIVNF